LGIRLRFLPTKTMSLALFLSKSYRVCISDEVTLLLFRHRPPYVHLRRGYNYISILMSCKFQLLHDDLCLDLRKESFTFVKSFNCFLYKGHAVGNSVESCKYESKPQNCFE
ncbi:unnamed protein product, partial [Brassica rapa subsp. narinosa]